MSIFSQLCLVALGSNLPQPEVDPASNLKQAIREMSERGLVIRAVSRFFETPCFPVGAGPDYVNAVAAVETDLEAPALLAVLHDVETMMGRTRASRWGMRTVDLDLIARGAAVCPDAATQAGWVDLSAEQQQLRAPEELILPHPRVADRAFVLIPLSDVAPHWTHPLSGKSVNAMLQDLPAQDLLAVRPI